METGSQDQEEVEGFLFSTLRCVWVCGCVWVGVWVCGWVTLVSHTGLDILT